MAKETLEKLEERIAGIRRQLQHIGDMRPGSLSVQYRKPDEGKAPFNQISYTHKGKGHSEYVRMENLLAVRREIKAYKRFRGLVEELVDLSIKASRLRHKVSKPTGRPHRESS